MSLLPSQLRKVEDHLERILIVPQRDNLTPYDPLIFISMFAYTNRVIPMLQRHHNVYMEVCIKRCMPKAGASRSSWPYKVDTYELYQLISENPRMRKKDVSRFFNVNEKTGVQWWNEAVRRGIIRSPIFRRKSFLNFREYYYYLEVDDPHDMYLKLKEMPHLTFFSVQSGFSNIQVVSPEKLNFKDTIISGARSDYYVTTPRNCSFDDSFSRVLKKLDTLGDNTLAPSPLVYHDEVFSKWDELDEKIYREINNDFRKSYRTIVRNTGVYSKRVLHWLRRRDEFGDAIVMYFPDGLSAYQPTTFFVETEYDSLLIDLFSCFPVSTVFFRIDDYVLLNMFLPFTLDREIPYRSMPYVILHSLKKRKLVSRYTNSIDQYYYRPQF